MVLIPEGPFIMGSRGNGGDEGILGVDVGVDQLPQREVFLKTFYIDKYEVTVREYKKFAKATEHPLPALLTADTDTNTDTIIKGIINLRDIRDWTGVIT